MSLYKNRTVLGILCITLSLMICFVITPLFNKEMAQKTEIVRVSAPIFTGQTITSDMVTVMEVGGYNLPETVVRNSETVVGSYALADFAVGDYILAEKISETLQAENAYLYRLDGTQQAISVTIPDFANGLSGKLQSGDIVSIIAPNFRDQGFTITPPELKYVEVISVTTSSGEDANLQAHQPEREDEDVPLPSTVTLLVNVLQSELIAELEAENDVHIALVFRGEKKDAQVFLDAQNEYLISLEAREGYYFDETTGEWVEIPEGFYFDEVTETLMGIPEGFTYDEELGELVPIPEEMLPQTEVNETGAISPDGATTPETPSTDGAENQSETPSDESEKEGEAVEENNESEEKS